MDAIDEYRLRFPWVYRVLQVILLCALILFLILRNDVAGMTFLGVCIVNLGIYFFIKMGRAVELSMVGTAVSLIENAKKIARRREIDNLFPELKQALSGLKGVMRGARFLSIQKDGRQGGDALEVFLDYVMGITLWQVTTYNKVMRRLSENVPAYLAVYECIGELDASVCTASFRKSLPNHGIQRIGKIYIYQGGGGKRNTGSVIEHVRSGMFYPSAVRSDYIHGSEG